MNNNDILDVEFWIRKGATTEEFLKIFHLTVPIYNEIEKSIQILGDFLQLYSEYVSKLEQNEKKERREELLKLLFADISGETETISLLHLVS